MPNRIIKESILTSTSIDALDDSAEIFFYRLLVIADDQGRFLASPGYLFSALFPLKADRFADDPGQLADFLRQIGDSLRQLAAAKIIMLYEVDGRQYGCFLAWEKHQRIRKVRPKHPAPEDSSITNKLQDPPQSAAKPPQVAAENGQPAAESAPNPIRIQSESESNPNKDTCNTDAIKDENKPQNDFLFELDIIDLYSQHFPPPTFPQLDDPLNTKLGIKVLKQIRARRREMKWGEEISPWSDFFSRANKSHWLTREMRYFNIEWLTRPTNFQKVWNGFYDDKKQTKGRGVAADELSDAEREKFDKFSE